MRVRLFGSVSVDTGSAVLGQRDFGGAKPKRLFELLVLARGEAVPKERLADRIWGEQLPQHVSATLETYVSVLRRRLAAAGVEGPSPIQTLPEAYAIPADALWLDLGRFDELARLADVAQPVRRRQALEEALALATGEVLADEPYADWAIEERERYRSRVVDVADRVAE